MGSQNSNEPDPPKNEEAINQPLYVRLITHKSFQSLNWDGF